LIEKKNGDHDFSSAHALLPADLAKSVIDWGKENIPDKDVNNEFGREDEPHVTVLYGLHDLYPDGVRDFLNNEKSFEIKLGKISAFTNNLDFDVIKIDVDDNEDLHRINKLLRQNFKYTSRFQVYKPHITIAYVKKGKGDDLKKSPLEGKSFKVSDIIFSSSNKTKTKIKLRK